MNPRAGPEYKNIAMVLPFTSYGYSLSPGHVKSWRFRGLRASYAAYTYQDPKQRHSGPRMDVEAILVGGSFPSC